MDSTLISVAIILGAVLVAGVQLFGILKNGADYDRLGAKYEAASLRHIEALARAEQDRRK